MIQDSSDRFSMLDTLTDSTQVRESMMGEYPTEDRPVPGARCTGSGARCTERDARCTGPGAVQLSVAGATGR